MDHGLQTVNINTHECSILWSISLGRVVAQHYSQLDTLPLSLLYTLFICHAQFSLVALFRSKVLVAIH